jgi:hypothetical protein
LLFFPEIITMTKLTWMKLAGHVACMEEKIRKERREDTRREEKGGERRG